MSFDISDFGKDVLDSRDIEARIDELESERSDWEDERKEWDELVEQIRVIENEKTVFESSDDPEDPDAEFPGQGELDRLQDELDNMHEPDDEFEYQDELDTLVEMRDEVGSSEWTYGLTLVHESYWVEYVEEFVKDIGDIPHNVPSYIEIDWEATASNIKVDYAEVTVENETYFYRMC